MGRQAGSAICVLPKLIAPLSLAAHHHCSQVEPALRRMAKKEQRSYAVGLLVAAITLWCVSSPWQMAHPVNGVRLTFDHPPAG